MLDLLSLSCVLQAQDIQVYSEFRRVDPFGEIVPQDRVGRPAEILSPLVARNTHASFQVVVSAPPGEHFYLFVGSNPEGIFGIDVYKEIWHKQEKGWVPDRLLRVDTPYLSHVPDRHHGIPNQTVEVFWIDVFVPKDLRPGRYKFEPQVTSRGRWATYPMEVRVSDAVATSHLRIPARLPGIRERADAVLLGPLRAFLCGQPEEPGADFDSIRSFTRRNVLEDLVLAREKEKTLGRDAVANQLLSGAGVDRVSFCAGGAPGAGQTTEWYLRGRGLVRRGSREEY